MDAPDAAERAAEEGIAMAGIAQQSSAVIDAVLRGLARRGWLHAPARVAALEAVAAAANEHGRGGGIPYGSALDDALAALDDALAALDDAPAAGAADLICARVDDQGGCGHPESRHTDRGCRSAHDSAVPCWCRGFRPY